MRKPAIWVAGGLAAIAMVAAGLRLVSSSGGSPGRAPAAFGDPLHVEFLSPRPGSPATVGIPVAIQVTAFGPNPLTAIELWADGALAEAFYPSADPPPTHMPVDFVWIPPSEGTHTLVARAIDNRQGSAESSSLTLHADSRALVEEAKGGPPDDEVEAVAIGGGTGPGGAAEPLPQPAPLPGPGEAAPAIEFNPSWIPAWVGGVFEANPPAAPDLAGKVEGCGVHLAIHDLSDNEDGFRLYRKLPGDKTWETIAELAGQSDAEYIAYSIDGATAASWFRAEAFNGKGQAVSLPLWLDGAGACSPQNDEVGTQVHLVHLASQVAADDAYCYASVGGRHWQRLPAVGFFPAKPGGFEVDQVVAEWSSFGLGGPDTSPTTLDLECWGWAGGSLQALGKLHLDSFPGSQPAFEVSGEALSALLEQAPVYHTLGGDADFPSPDDFAIGGDPNLPYTFALVTDNVENCKSHTPSGGGNLIEALLFCTPYPEFPDGTQPYLTWWLIEGACPAGKGSDCYSLDDLQQAIDDQGGKLGFTVYDCDTSGLCYTHNFPLDLTAFVIPPFTACGEPRYFVAQFNVYLGSSDYPTLSGPGSPPFQYSLPCPEAYETEGFVTLDVSFDTLTIGDADDGDGGSEDLEIFGYFKATTTSGESRQLNLGLWGFYPGDCPGNETLQFVGGLSTQGGGGPCPSQVSDGSFGLAEAHLCLSDYSDACFLWPENVATDHMFDNNHIQLTVLEGDAVIVQAVLVDYDSGSPNDTACHVLFSTPEWPLETWAGMKGGQFFGSQGDNGNASCTVSVTLTAVGP